MAAFSQKNDFSKGVNLDKDELRLPENAVVFLKNLTRNTNLNTGTGTNSGAGSNQDIESPIEGNVALTVSLPSGTNYCIGFYSAESVNEGYFFLWNSSNNHSIWVIRGDTGVVQKVYQSSLLNFQYLPEYFIATGRCTLELESYVDPVTGAETNFKFLCFTDNYNEPRLISVEDSIATSSYTLPAPYFAGAGTNYIADTLITLGVPLPIMCMGLNTPTAYVPNISSDGIAASSVANGGALWAVGGTFTVGGGSPLAEGKVTGVSAGGVVTSFIITLYGGGYSLASGVAATATSGVGIGLTINILALQPPDAQLQNSIVRQAWQFRVKFIDVFGRESEHGIISSQYITIIGGGCLAASNGLPRCLDINFDAGNPLVDYIQIEYRLWVDATTPVDGEWQLYDTISKWNNSGALQWYQRTINPELVYNSGTNVITYTFCADKNVLPIDREETSRTQTGVPRLLGSLFAINKRIGGANAVRGFEPIDPDQLAKIIVSAKNPTEIPCEAAPLRRVEVYANIFRPLFPGDPTGICRISHERFVWGNVDGDCGDEGSFAADQVFGDQDNPGFIGYMAGMSGSQYAAISEQGDFDPATGIFTPTGIVSSMSFPHTCMQKFTFSLPAGKYILRIASHKTKITDPNLQSTSTYVAGLIKVSDIPVSRYVYAQNPYKEIEIDCTSGNVILNGNSGIYGAPGTDPIFIILDLSVGSFGGAIDGYLYEQADKDVPVEMNPVYIKGRVADGSVGDAYGSFYTDHNGFYFCYTVVFGRPVVQIFSNLCDVAGTHLIKEISPDDSGPVSGGIWHGDGTNTSVDACGGVRGNYLNRVYIADGITVPVFPECARRRIKQKITLCADNTVGVPGVPIILTKGAFRLTGVSGNAEIVAHNRYTYLSSIGSNPAPPLAATIPDFGTSPLNKDSLVFSQKGGCQWDVCDSCVTSMSDIIVDYVGCCTPCDSCRIIEEPELHVRVAAVDIYGIQSGGRYEVVAIFHDELGRHTFAQKVGYVSAANLNDSGYQQFALQSIQYNIAAGFTAPTVFKYMTFAVSKNIVFKDFFMWSADWVQFIDNTGQTNSVNPTAVRIYYGSIIEYAKVYNFATQTGWQFFSTDQDGNPLDSPTEGDVVQFIMNGNGDWIDSGISSSISYNKSGSFFTIEFTNELLSLTNGCLFKVIRPAKIQVEESIYYEQCLTIKLDENGQIPSGQRNGIIPYFDSYLLARLLPVPLFAGHGTAIPPGLPAIPPLRTTSTGTTSTGTTTGLYVTNNLQNSNAVIIMQTEDANVAFPFYFESPSPSDFWGNHVANRGRVFVHNPYEEQKRTGTEIALSDALSDRGTLNGLSYFESKNAQVFDRNTWGDIVSVLVETSIMLVICERGYFMTQFNASQLRQDASGNIVAQNQLGIFTSPQVKAGTNFGCTQTDINSIARYAGVAIWVDSGGYLVFCNFSEAKAVQNNGYDAWLKNKIGYNNVDNLTPTMNGRKYFVGGIDVKTWEYYLTSFRMAYIDGSPSYINTESATNLAANETIVVDMESGMLKGFASFTPEIMGNMSGYFIQPNFLSFKQGVPYIHHGNRAKVTPPLYAKFYGTQCECRITLVSNIGPDKVKRFFYVEVYNRAALLTGIVGTAPQVLFFSDSVTTEKNQLSRLKPLRWTIKDGINCAEFLCDLNTPPDPNLLKQTGINKLLDGNNLQGRWLKASFVTQSSYAGTYFEVSSIIIHGNGIDKSGE